LTGAGVRREETAAGSRRAETVSADGIESVACRRASVCALRSGGAPGARVRADLPGAGECEGAGDVALCAGECDGAADVAVGAGEEALGEGGGADALGGGEDALGAGGDALGDGAGDE